jgi:glycosyltransferase involved in cell wall biosynthesis
VEPDFSICVPTFNRSALIDRWFNSLRAHTGVQFELIVVKDGSSDDTREKLETLARTADFPVVALHGERQGRGAALNRAFDAARGRFIFIMDDDDLIPAGALDRILAVWNSIPASSRSLYCGVCGICSDFDGQPIGHAFPDDVVDSDFFSMRIVNGIRGDKREVFLRESLGDYRFPVVAGEKRVATNFLWFHLASRYKTRFVNDVWLLKDRRADGITASGLRQKVTSPQLTAQYYRRTLELFPDMPLKIRYRFAINYFRFSSHGQLPAANWSAGLDVRSVNLPSALIGRMIASLDRRKLRIG